MTDQDSERSPTPEGMLLWIIRSQERARNDLQKTIARPDVRPNWINHATRTLEKWTAWRAFTEDAITRKDGDAHAP